MATSQNGWTVRFEGDTSIPLVKCPPIIGYIRGGDVAVVLGYVLEQYDKRVEDAHKGADDWGWNVRPIRGQNSGYSNHASATAFDVNATRHPRGVNGTFSAAQKKEVLKILAEVDGTVRWGELYNQRIAKIDGMHFEIDAGAAAVKKVADRIRGDVRPVITPPTKPVTKPKPVKAYPFGNLALKGTHDTASDRAWRMLLSAIKFDDDDLTKNFQRWLQKLGYLPKGADYVDGKMQTVTIKALQRFLQAKGLLPKGAAYVDGKREALTIKAERAYLNSQARYLRDGE